MRGGGKITMSWQHCWQCTLSRAGTAACGHFRDALLQGWLAGSSEMGQLHDCLHVLSSSSALPYHLLYNVSFLCVCSLHYCVLQPKEIGLPFTAYTAIDEVREVRQRSWLECHCMADGTGHIREEALPPELSYLIQLSSQPFGAGAPQCGC